MRRPCAFRETSLRLLAPGDQADFRRVGRSLDRHWSEAGLYTCGEMGAAHSELTAIAKDLHHLQWTLRHDTGAEPEGHPRGAPQRLAWKAREWAGEVGAIARSIEAELAAAGAEEGGGDG